MVNENKIIDDVLYLYEHWSSSIDWLIDWIRFKINRFEPNKNKIKLSSLFHWMLLRNYETIFNTKNLFLRRRMMYLIYPNVIIILKMCDSGGGFFSNKKKIDILILQKKRFFPSTKFNGKLLFSFELKMMFWDFFFSFFLLNYYYYSFFLVALYLSLLLLFLDFFAKWNKQKFQVFCCSLFVGSK